MNRISRTQYEPFAALQHLFLVGNLQRENPHVFVRDSRVELIVCLYNPGDDGLPHWHRAVTEYEFVLEGEIGYLDVATGEIQWFGPGDLRILTPGTCAQRIIRRPTRTIAVKVPSSDDKIHCQECPRACAMRLAPCHQEARCESR